MDELLKELIEFIKSASPMVWETFQRQVYVAAAYSIVWGVIALVSGIALLWLARYWYNKKQQISDHYDRLDYSMGTWLSVILGVSILAGSLAFFMDAAAHYMNPNYYTIQLILGNLQ